MGGSAYLDRGCRYEMRVRSLTFYTSSHELSVAGGDFATVAVPDDANVGTFSDQLVISLRSAWLGHEAGSLLAAPVAAFMKAADDAARGPLLSVLFAPTETCSLLSSSETKNYLIVSALEDVVGELRFWRYDRPSAGWSLERTFKGVGYASPSAAAVSAEESDAIWLTSSSYTQPTTLAIAEAAAPAEQERLKSLPAFYEAEGLQTQQLFATSADGTRVPYFIVSREAAPLDGSTPTLLYGYGGFEISLTPGYSAAVGAAWLEKGFAYVQANIRGGGEYGPRWHQAALREKRHKAYEDFEAVARDLVSRGVTSPQRLGCIGGSNGGLLTGNMITREGCALFGAVVCQVLCSAHAHGLHTQGTEVHCSARTARRRALPGAPQCTHSSASLAERKSPGRCRCSTCAGTTSCWRAPRGWASTATRTSPPSGRLCRRTRPTTTSPPIRSTHPSYAPPRRATTACTRATLARWCASSTTWASRPPTTTRTSRAATAARPTTSRAHSCPCSPTSSLSRCWRGAGSPAARRRGATSEHAWPLRVLPNLPAT